MTDANAASSGWRWAVQLALFLLLLNGLFLGVNFMLLLNTNFEQSPLILPPSPGTDNAILLQQAIDDAERATDTINTTLSLVQGGAVILGFLATGVTLYGVWNSRQLRSQLDEAQKIREDLQTLKEQTKKLENLGQLREKLQAEIKSVTQSSRALSLVQIGQHEIALSNYDTAIDILETACKLDSNNPVVLYFLGDAYLRDDKLDKGEFNLDKAIQKSNEQYGLDRSPFLQARASYAYLLRLKGDKAKEADKEYRHHYADAEAEFLRLYAENPKLLDVAGESVFGALAGLYRREGDIEEAIYWYKKCKKITPRNTYPLNNLAQLFLQQGKQTEAMTQFKEIQERARRKVNANPDDYWLLFDYMTARIAGGDGLNGTSDLDVESVAAKLTLAYKLTDDLVIPLEKFLYGLEALRKIKSPLPDLENIIQQVKAEIERREG